jgi:hypothetical protein
MLKRLCTGSMLVLLMALALAGSARADAVKGGALSLKLTPAVTRDLARGGVSVERLGPARARGRVVTLPIDSGLLEARYGSGYLFLDGGFRVRAGRRSVAVRRPIVNFAEHWMRATVSGRKMRFAELSPQRAARDGFDLNIALQGAKLTPRAAATLNRGLGKRGLLGARRPFAAVSALARLETLSFKQGTIAFELDERFQAKLQSVGVSVVPFETAAVSGPPVSVTLPVWRGAIASDLSTGVVLSQDGFRFVQGGGPSKAEISFAGVSLALDSHLMSATGSIVSEPPRGPLGAAPFAAVRFDNGVVLIDRKSGELTAPKRVATLSSYAAAPLNEVFGAPRGMPTLFVAGEPVGRVGFTVASP